MKDMIMGVETEYGLYFIDRKTNKPPQNKENILKKFKDFFDEYLQNINQSPFYSTSQYLENGGRLYIDTNIHPEYATSECSSAIEIVKYLKAGHNSFYGFNKPIEKKFKESGYDIAITFLADNKALNPEYSNNSNNVDVYNTYGTHENYCIPRDSYNSELVNYLYPFFATRQIYSGAGGFFANQPSSKSRLKFQLKYPYGFVLSPRAFFIEEELNNSTTSTRPMINTRDEPHADEALRRLHILCGESNRSDSSNWLKVGVTALVISAFCKKPSVFKNMPNLVNTLSSFKVISRECEPNKKNVLCVNEKASSYFYLSAVDIQKIYLERAGEYVSGEKNDKEAKQIISEWAKILVMLERNDEELEYILDWKIKQKLFRDVEHKRKAENRSFTDWDRAKIDIKYHDINPGGIFSILEKEREIKKLVSDNDVFEALTYPPLTTRALARGTAIKICKQLGLNRVIDNWTSIKIDGEDFTLLNPFLPNRSASDNLTDNSPLRDIFAAHYPELDKFLKRKTIETLETLGNKPRT